MNSVQRGMRSLSKENNRGPLRCARRLRRPAATPVCFLLLLTLSRDLRSQPAPAQTPLTIAQAVEDALRNYPSIRVTQEQMNAAAAGIRLAQTAYLPRVDALAQMNRATRNTFYGLLLPAGHHPGRGWRSSEQSRLGLGQRLGRSGHLAAVRFWFARSQRRGRHGGARSGPGNHEPDAV